MSRWLRDIPTSCKMFDKAILELKDIETNVDIEVWETIRKNIEYAIDYIEEARGVNGDLRDTCVDIAEEKNKEIGILLERINELENE